MSDRLEGKVAVITGGASGIGRATVRRFLDEGASVVVADLNEANGAATVSEAQQRGHGERVCFEAADVAEEADVQRLVASAVARFGRLDCLFNNAGVGGAVGSILETDVEDWDRTFAIMTRGVFLGIKHGARAMIDAEIHGSIINTASVAGLSGGAGPIAYSAAKAAVINLTRAAARELAAKRVRVNAICPGGILTPLIDRAGGGAVAAMLAKLQPWPDHGTPEDIAGAALFLASDDARFVTGEALVVDGGLTAAGPSSQRGSGLGDGGALAGLSGFDQGSTGRDFILRSGG